VRLFWDIETDGLLDTVSKVWCVVAIDLDTRKEYVWNCNGLNGGIEAAIEFLSKADLLVAHNGHRYDIHALRKLFGWKPRLETQLQDTMVLARLRFPNQSKEDKELVRKGRLPSKLSGSDSLKAWGYRIGEHKAEYDGGWNAWSQEMEDYCVQDCRTGVALWWHINPDDMSQAAIELEHQLAFIAFEMETAGWYLDEKAAHELYTELVGRRHELEKQLVAKFGSWQEVDKVFVPKRDNAKLGYKKGVAVTKYKTVTFNPGSRRHIEKKLREMGWTPVVFTPSGAAKLDEEILENIDIPEAKLIIEYLLVQKRLGQLADGENGLLKQVRNGKIHCWYKTLGTNTGRCAHARPNVAQTPKNKAPYGKQFRALYTVPPGWSLVGADFEGLELRCLAHCLSFYDNGAYSKIVTDGDVHQYHADMLGGVDRDTVAKRYIYAWLYGAQPPLLSTILKCTVAQAKRTGENFLKRVPGLDKLKDKVNKGARKGYIKGLDGRHIPIRSSHSAFNALLQSYGAVLCKRWLVDSYFALLNAGLRWGYDGDFVIVGWIHDELQIACREGLEATVGEIVVECARRAGDRYGFRCRLDSKWIPGKSWKDTH